MALAPGARFGPYEVVEPIGSGGMGEVYRATDASLKRDVALKVLPENRRLDPEASMRFEREARLLAALNHPNIATLHGLETSGDVQALVMELVDGEGLDDRIARAPHGLPVGEALEIAAQVATALDAAHESGVIHRDLKPANIRIRPDGTVKVLDFGVAKAFATDGASGDVSTLTQMPGAIIGTPSYMSPEQAGGADVDRKTDIWAFGCVLYEMLTGQRVFDGETSSRIVARVLERDPDWNALPADLPPRARTLLGQCLEKNVRRRRRDAGDVRLELELAASEPAGRASTGPEGIRSGVALLAGTVVIVALALIAAFYFYSNEEAMPQSVFDLVTPTTRQPFEIAVSPDGRHVAFVASKSEETIERVLYVRNLETGDVDPVRNSEGARHPCWSPDSRSIAYFAREYLHSVAINSGDSQRLAPALNGAGCSWGENGQILFTPSFVTGLYSVPASGEGEHREVTQLNLAPVPGDPTYESFHRFPAFIGDSDRFLYHLVGGREVRGIYLGSLDGSPSKRLIASGSAGVFVAPDWVVYDQNNRLVAQRLDLARGELTGEPQMLAELATVSGEGRVFSASRDGQLFAYRDTPPPASLLTVFDRSGAALSTGPGLNGVEISPDDRSLAYDSGAFGSRDVYVSNIDGTGGSRIVGDATVEGYPEFSPNGRELIYEKQRPDDKFFELWKVEINRGDEAHRYYTEAEAERNLIPLDWSVNDYILFRRSDHDFLSSDLVAVPASAEDPTPIVIADSEFEERLGEVSPDGNWIVYDSNRAGDRFGIYVQAFPENDKGIHQVTNDGFAPRWNAGGTEIIFLTVDGSVMAASFSNSGQDPEVGGPVELFRAEIAEPSFNHAYDLTRDGRLLMNIVEVDESPLPIRLIQNPTVFAGDD